jgi:Trk K+ transport system NAD-binding subunit
MAKGAGALIFWLFIVAAFVILVLSLVVMAASVNDETIHWYNVVWVTFMHALDSGAVDSDSGDVVFIGIMLVASLAGMFLLSTLIGLINAGIEAKLETLRRGRSKVLESDHTVILGWSPHVMTIISQLVIANESRHDACIVILAEKDKVEMEEEIRSQITNLRTTRVVCRSGNPHEATDLMIVSAETARAIIIPPPETEHPDITVIKIILALVKKEHSFADNHNIVTSILDSDNLEVARIAGGHHLRCVLFEDLISRITAQTCRQSGLSVVYSELLQYEGSEFYFHEEPRLANSTFEEAALSFEKSTVIGISRSDGSTIINPPRSELIGKGDRVILLSEDDSEIVYTGRITPQEYRFAPASTKPQHAPEKFLFIHWNTRAIRILHELDRYVSTGSVVTVIGVDEVEKSGIENQCMELNRITIIIKTLDPARSQNLKDLGLNSFNHIIVLAKDSIQNKQEVDARTLAILLMIRNTLGGMTNGISIVSEMHDVRNRELADAAQADDFIVSSQLDSMLMTQISEDPRLADVFEDLFDADGAEIYLKDVNEYFSGEVELPFATLVALCLERGQTAIGYRRIQHAHDSSRNYGVKINPPKSASVRLGPEDRLIVISAE